MITLKTTVYRTGQFAKRACVSLRTLRFYDQVGLLSPSGHTESGYRLYTDDDLVTLQQILALKYLGLSLDEIRDCMRRRPERLRETLARQKLLMAEKRRHLDGVIRAIAAAEAGLEAGTFEWSDLTGVIEAMQMEQNKEWVKGYFTDEQLNTMGELGRQSYSEEAARTLAARPEWTEEDQKRASAQWKHIADESSRLAEAGADPAGVEGQALAKLQTELLSAFTQGDPEVESGLAKFWQNHNALSQSEQPLASWSGLTSGPAAEFLQKAVQTYRERQTGGGQAG
jgi:MerR family transcriptional regulator, thiopeptide resistance regulator